MTDDGPHASGVQLAGPAAAFASLVRSVATDLLEARDELNRLDGVAGDGDLGLTVTTAARALIELAPTLAELEEADAIRRCGTELARRAPSTGGTLLAFAFMAAGKAGVDPGAPPVERAAGYLDAAAGTIAERGRVSPGDRTLLDALRPAADAVRAAADAAADIASAARDAAQAADDGARATASMDAKVGRAGWLAERAAGSEDAGARLIAIAAAAVARRLAAAAIAIAIRRAPASSLPAARSASQPARPTLASIEAVARAPSPAARAASRAALAPSAPASAAARTASAAGRRASSIVRSPGVTLPRSAIERAAASR